jgi:hydroxymethylglutaryl-CoA lyase
MVFFFSVSRSHNLNNTRQEPEASLSELRKIKELFLNNSEIEIRVDLATVFGCPFEGKIEKGIIMDYVEQVASLGISEITLCDTVGFGNPRQVEEIASACLLHFPEVRFGAHFHNTRGLGIANVLTAYRAGICRFDASIGGLGGCPFAPGASGNTATEEVVFLFNEMGIDTGIEIKPLLDTALYLNIILPELKFTGALMQAGLPDPSGKICRS